MKPSRSTITTTLRGTFGVAVLLFLIVYLDTSALTTLSAHQIAASGLIVLALVATTWLEAARLQQLSRHQFPFRTTLGIVFSSCLITNFLPSSIGGDGYKIVKFANNSTYVRATALIFTERLIGLLVLIGGAVLFVIILGSAKLSHFYYLGSQIELGDTWVHTLITVMIALMALSAFPVFLYRSKLLGLLLEFKASVAELPLRNLLAALLWTCALHSIRALLLGVSLAIAGYSLGFAESWIVLAFTAIVSMLPMSVGGLGIRESAFIIALQPFGIPGDWALFVGLVFRVASIAQAGIGALLIFNSRQGSTDAKPYS